MQQYERHRVPVEQCTQCGGLFLDRGELGVLAAAERAYYGAPDENSVAAEASVPGESPAESSVPAPIYDDRRYDHGPRDRGLNERRYDDDRRLYGDGYSGRSVRRQTGSFVEELFGD